jgi:hypothetical protein
MPVSVLLCEGSVGSPDPRILGKILAGICEVRPLGGKYGMGDRILARREASGAATIFGILDGDFREWSEPREEPIIWNAAGANNPTQLGWRWERKEIENYLIDPVVVEHALGSLPAGYCDCLDQVAARIGPYQAARLALTLVRPRFKPLSNCFGKKRGGLRHQIPDDLDDASCLVALKAEISEWNLSQAVNCHEAEEAFNRTLPECKSGGERFQNYLSGFAGKDLLVSMADHLQVMGFDSPAIFLETVLSAIASKVNDVSEWLPEWKKLKESVARNS